MDSILDLRFCVLFFVLSIASNIDYLGLAHIFIVCLHRTTRFRKNHYFVCFFFTYQCVPYFAKEENLIVCALETQYKLQSIQSDCILPCVCYATGLQDQEVCAIVRTSRTVKHIKSNHAYQCFLCLSTSNMNRKHISWTQYELVLVC